MSDFTEGYSNKLKNKLFGLLCEFEKKGEWEKFLEFLIILLEYCPETSRTINYYILYYKISSLRYLRYDYFRSTVFSCMTLLGKSDELF